ncbi:MAG: transcription termination/antitermination protein NusG [Elusimicrobia bacterium]|nr:transcription termination/antitermination protein NusG [Elusimicrobiota bacterium]
MALNWYVIHTMTNYEEKVKNELEKQIANLNLNNMFGQMLIPTEEVVEVKKNKKITKKRKYYPGYVFIQMEINNETYWIVRNTTGVSGFLGGLKPTALPEDEVKNVINLVEAPPPLKPKPAIIFEKEESVRIIEGPFANFIGIIEEVNEEKGKLKVMVSIFGRSTPVELDFLQVEKL